MKGESLKKREIQNGVINELTIYRIKDIADLGKRSIFQQTANDLLTSSSSQENRFA